MPSLCDCHPHLDLEHGPVIGSLCTGYGGLDLGVLGALGGGRIAWVADPDPHIRQILEARMPDIPNHGDLRAIDWTAVEPVDVVVAGFPCQDISAAGRRAGIEKGTRSGLWTDIVAGVRVLRPALVVVENVAALRWKGGGLHRVLGDLAEAGYDALWRSVRAADIGAAHRRERVFLLAWNRAATRPDAADTTGARRRQPRPGGPSQATRSGAPGQLARRRACLRHITVLVSCRSDCRGCAEQQPSCSDRRIAPARRSTANADAHGCRLAFRRDPDGAQIGASNPGRLYDSDRFCTAPAHASRDRQRHRGSQGREGFPAAVVATGAAAGRSDLADPLAAQGDQRDDESSAAPQHVGGRQSTHEGSVATSRQPLGRSLDERSRGHLRVVSDINGVPVDFGNRPGSTSPAPRANWGVYEAAVRRWERVARRPVPYPTQPGKHGRPVLAPRFVEHLMGLPEGWVTDLSLPRTAQLRALGNGVVPQQATHAVSVLLADLAALLHLDQLSHCGQEVAA
ncbi:hypothetical protein JCM33774_45360 [Actinophytocola sp. KF-1]